MPARKDPEGDRRIANAIRRGMHLALIVRAYGVGQHRVYRIAREQGLTLADGNDRKMTIVREGPNYAGQAAHQRWGYELGAF